MGIHAIPQDRGKVKELQAHSQHDPRDRKAGPGSPAALGVLVFGPRVPTPEDILHEAACDIGRHIVCIIPTPEFEVGHVAHVQDQTQQRPRAQHRAPSRGRPIQPEMVHDGIVQSIEHIEPGPEVIEFLGDLEIARVEDAAKEPAHDADVGKRHVKGAEGVRGGDGGADLAQARDVGPEVRGGEEDGEGFLDAEEARKGPFAVELYDGEGGGLARGGDDVLARVVAFGGTVPEEEAEVEGCKAGASWLV